MWVKLVQSVEVTNSSKGWPSPERKFFLPDCLQLWQVSILTLDILTISNFESFWTSSLPAFVMWLHYELSWFSGLQTRTGTIHWLSWAFWVSGYIYVSRYIYISRNKYIFIVYLSIYLSYLYILLILLLGEP